MNKVKHFFNSSNVIALFAVFVAMAGTAVAVTKAPKNSVTSPSIRNGAITGKDVKDDTLTGTDIDERSLDVAGTRGAPGPEGPAGPQGATGPAGPSGVAEIGPNTIGSEEVTNDSLTGADVNEEALGAVPVARQGGTGRYAYVGSCDPNKADLFDQCAEGSIQLRAPGRLLLIGTLEAQQDSGKPVGLADCRLWTDRGTVYASTTAVSVSDDYESEQATLTAVTGVVPSGTTNVGLECNERPTGGPSGIHFPMARMSIVSLSGD